MSILPQLKVQTRVSQLPDSFYRRVNPQALSNPYLVAFSPAVADLLDIDPILFQDQQLINLLSGSEATADSDPIAMIYAGHQFGHFVPQLGDGRALMIGEIADSAGTDWEIQLKGSGLTPFSRMGDGRAVLRSTIREYLCSEAIAALGIPTTRALCITGSRDAVYRERPETAAVLTRVAPSHLRFGNFEVFFYRQQYAELKILADFIIEQFYPDCGAAENPYVELLRQVIERTARLVAQWQLVGFTHGVLNSDNMSMLGLTIDYGPYGFLDTYQSAFVCNHSDELGRYAYDQQPRIGLFNLSCLAQAMLPLIDEKSGELAAEQAKQLLADYQPAYLAHYYQGMAAKLGLQSFREGDEALISSLFALMEKSVDFTNFFRRLSEVGQTEESGGPGDMFIDREGFAAWYQDFLARLETDKSAEESRRRQMLAVNPKFVLRNYLAQQAIERAEQGDFSEVETLHDLLQKPFEEQHERADYAAEPPDWARHIDLSCSS
ncbi:MAG: YdiU family protein [Gammaproteobacteria bacterium]